MGKLDLLQGTLDLMVLKTLAAMGPQHGYGIARRLEQRGWIESSWGVSDNNRKAKFYAITADGRKQLAADARYWERLTGVMEKVLAMSNEGGPA